MATRKARLDNYFFVEIQRPNVFVDLQQHDKPYCIRGEAERELDYGTFNLKTGEVIKKEKNVAYTVNDIAYTLENMHPDYKDYLEAVKKGIPVICSWVLMGRDTSGYYVAGYCDHKRVGDIVVSQEGNYITFESGEKYFVMWSDIGIALQEVIDKTHYVTDGISFPENFEMFANKLCRPVLFE